MIEEIDALRKAAALMSQDSDSAGLNERTDKRFAETGGQDPVVFLRAWSRLLIESAHWMEMQQIARVLPDLEIVGVMQFHIEVARTYLAERDAVPA